MNIPTQQQAYAIGTGSAKIPSFIFSDRDPSSSNFNHDLYTGWVNTQTKGIWYLEGVAYSGGATLAQWRCSPPVAVFNSDPTTADYSHPIGQVWVNQVSGAYWALVSISGTTATWVNLASGSSGSGILTVTPDTGGAVGADALQNISIIGYPGLTTTTGYPVLNTIVVSLDSSAILTRVQTQAFFSSGTYTPTVDMKYAVIEVVGAGGGGGGYARGLFPAATIGASQVATVGIGGAGGTGAGLVVGSNGGATSLGSLASATGGRGGNAGALPLTTLSFGGFALGGAGGAGSGSGGISIAGSPGFSSCSYGTGTSLSAASGGGGSSFLSANSSGNVANHTYGSDSTTGALGANYGGGGSGGASVSNNGSVACTGGPGANGYILITEYI